MTLNLVTTATHYSAKLAKMFLRDVCTPPTTTTTLPLFVRKLKTINQESVAKIEDNWALIFYCAFRVSQLSF